MTFGLFRKTAGMLGLSFLAVAAGAQGTQPAAQPPAPTGALNIPDNVAFVGNRADTNVARASAVVNNEIITRSDIEHRVNLFLASRRGAQVSPEEMDLLRQQVLRSLIDEALQIQRAREQDITVERAEVDRYYARFSQEFGQTAQGFSDYLRTIGSSDRTVKRQIEGELAWTQLQRRMPRPTVTNEEVEATLARMLASRGAPEYHVAEIYLSAAPENAAQVRQRMSQLSQQIRAGAAFPAVARQFSEATTAARGGDLGWVTSDKLPPELAAVVQQMPVGAISDPIQLPDGFSLVALVDSRQSLMANPRDAVLSLMQMSIDLPAGTTEPQARQRAAQLAQATQAMGGCGRAADTARQLGAELVANDSEQVRNLPPQLEQTLLRMNVGEVTQPFGTLQRISVLILCGREDPRAAATPTAQSVQDTIAEERIGRQAQRLMRDIRRDAVIEYR